MTSTIAPRRRVAIIDDDQEEVYWMRGEVEEAGYEPVPFVDLAPTVEALVKEVQNRGVAAAICDHRLSVKATAHFWGAEAVAALIKSGIPALLVTRFADVDSNLGIRQFRRDVPVVLSKDELTGEAVAAGIQTVSAEIADNYSPERVSYRTLVQVVGYSSESEQPMVEAILPSWRPRQAVRFPASLIPAGLQPHSEDEWPGTCYIAWVNIGAEEAEDLYFYDFERAPDPDPEDGLA
jgi:hypothetical protein